MTIQPIGNTHILPIDNYSLPLASEDYTENLVTTSYSLSQNSRLFIPQKDSRTDDLQSNNPLINRQLSKTYNKVTLY